MAACALCSRHSPLVFVVGVGRTVRGQRQRFDVVAHVRRVTARALRVQERHARVTTVRVHVKS